ncbi:MAG TPA: DUF2157 domain-containing protein [Terriglobales bacterium]
MPISELLDQKLQSWERANLMDPDTAARIRAFESAEESPRMKWQVWVAIAFGAVMIGAGVLLFVAAHWDRLSPSERFALVLMMVAGFHVAAGILTPRLHALGIALHAVGTASLGAGIFLAGQIFNLQEHWPSAILLWAIGALLAWLVLRDWVQASLAALLWPAWLVCEWGVRTEHFRYSGTPMLQFITLLAIAYLGAQREAKDTAYRRALAVIGAIAVLPASVMLAIETNERGLFYYGRFADLPKEIAVLGYLGAFVLPLAVSYILRRRNALWTAGFALWVLALPHFDASDALQNVLIYLWCALGSIALVLWGIREYRRERINVGVAGFAITIIAFYFSTMMDKLGRSASLIAFGLLFLLGGWRLEKLRRKLVARAAGGAR